MSSETVFVQILDKEYQVACPPGERDALMQAARKLDERMRDIRAGGNVIGLERIAVMAALNLSHELLEAKNVVPDPVDNDTLQRLTEKLDRALDKF
ncbi:cell division protein ZapA [Pseudomaricurvus alkylphenolicus]|jgi:cell division protein ZapA|uniref:cell division protein ZapA n=1 Tax=Pseudomaricurvus alkylphenolicus TaxID=1306991 RepID=UPI00141F2332|nr:cell division protein ZapA [Pseudomaricurvus alkylphenolicus]NIB39639.1 cell division protein ZapA [Pseudomaricurvus alkylphenolicus]